MSSNPNDLHIWNQILRTNNQSLYAEFKRIQSENAALCAELMAKNEQIKDKDDQIEKLEKMGVAKDGVLKDKSAQIKTKDRMIKDRDEQIEKLEAVCEKVLKGHVRYQEQMESRFEELDKVLERLE
ncbi:hypothetical protein PMIN06_007376 [Paraphaeosphaeria minitans]